MPDQHNFLYVEDDPLSREIMQVVMEATMGITSLIMFEDSANFMERLQALPTRPDLILLDIHLEPHSGFDLLQMLKHHADYQNTIIIAITASVMNEEIEQLRASGFDGAIAKPIDVEGFSHLIKQVLKGESIWHVL